MAQAIPTTSVIDKKASLDELRLLEQSWNEHARVAGYPELCWDIVRWLGEKTHLPDWQSSPYLWEIEKIAIIGNEVPTKYLTGQSTFQYERRYSVWYAAHPKSFQTEHAIDSVVMNAVCVMDWGWFVTYDKDGVQYSIVENPNNYFVNGEWILTARNFIQEAQIAKDRYTQSLAEFERAALAQKLLIGERI